MASKKTPTNKIDKAARKYDSSASSKNQRGNGNRGNSGNRGSKGFRILLIVLLCIFVAVAVYGYYNGWFDEFLQDGNENPPVVVQGDLSVHFLQLGNKYTGDSVYVKAGETDILIDAGSRNDSGPQIAEYLKNYVTDGKLEYVIATHAHQDHIAGFYSQGTKKGIFDSFETGTIIDFALTNNSSAPPPTSVYGRYLSSRDAEIDEGATHYTAAQCFDETDGASRTYQLSDDVEMEILYNYYYYNTSSSENDYSVCIMLHQGDYHYLFTGDLEASGEKKMAQYYEDAGTPLPHCVLYKAGHHGSKTSSSKQLMEAIQPQYVCVCCCAGTSEYTDNDLNQFPTQDFVDNVSPYTDKVYVTTMVDNYVDKNSWSKEGTVKPMNGTIVFSCTDGTITLQCSNNDTILKDTEWFSKHRTMPEPWITS